MSLGKGLNEIPGCGAYRAFFRAAQRAFIAFEMRFLAAALMLLRF